MKNKLPKWALKFATDLYAELFARYLELNGKDFPNNDESLAKEMAEFMADLDKGELAIMADHKQTLLDQAAHFEKLDKQISLVFFATFFEHAINEMILHACNKKPMKEEDILKVIRNVNLDGKFTWLGQLLGFPKINNSHLKTILTVSEARNFYLHYKFNEDLDKKYTYHTVDISLVKKTVTYIKSIKTKFIYGGKKNKFLKENKIDCFN
jgi:hypothetical protein